MRHLQHDGGETHITRNLAQSWPGMYLQRTEHRAITTSAVAAADMSPAGWHQVRVLSAAAWPLCYRSRQQLHLIARYRLHGEALEAE